jgi:hypothetical protein
MKNKRKNSFFASIGSILFCLLFTTCQLKAQDYKLDEQYSAIEKYQNQKSDILFEWNTMQFLGLGLGTASAPLPPSAKLHISNPLSSNPVLQIDNSSVFSGGMIKFLYTEGEGEDQKKYGINQQGLNIMEIFRV